MSCTYFRAPAVFASRDFVAALLAHVAIGIANHDDFSVVTATEELQMATASAVHADASDANFSFGLLLCVSVVSAAQTLASGLAVAVAAAAARSESVRTDAEKIPT